LYIARDVDSGVPAPKVRCEDMASMSTSGLKILNMIMDDV
jgi:hypothetical protein